MPKPCDGTLSLDISAKFDQTQSITSCSIELELGDEPDGNGDNELAFDREDDDFEKGCIACMPEVNTWTSPNLCRLEGHPVPTQDECPSLAEHV